MPLSELDLLALWTAGELQHPIDRALSALATSGRTTRGRVADLPLGERDRRLLGVCHELAGRRIAAIARCPACGEANELGWNTDELGAALGDGGGGGGGDGGGGDGGELVVEHGVVTVRCRQPTSRDLAAAAEAGSEAEARRRLLRAAVIEARDGDGPLAADALADDVVARIEDRLAEMSPPAEIVFAITCAACGQPWSAPFDPGETVWTAIDVAARRTMDTVAELARAYGWTEADVLALPPARRRYYLERA